MTHIEEINWASFANSIDPLVNIGDSKYNYIKENLINNIFPVLLESDKISILDSLVTIINFIHYKYLIAANILWEQLVQNQLLDLRALIQSLLPYISDDSNDSNKKKLRKLQDIYTKKNKHGKYIYSNSQYNRCIRHHDFTTDKTKILYRPYLKEYMDQNLRLLLYSIEASSHKLHINWIDILPYDMMRYKDSELYKLTLPKVSSEITSVKFVDGYIDCAKGLSYGDIYNTISNHFYNGIVRYKWLIYDVFIEDKPITVVSYFKTKTNLEIFWKNKIWSELSNSEREDFEYFWRTMLSANTKQDEKIIKKLPFFFYTFHPNAKKLMKQKKFIIDDVKIDKTEFDETRFSLLTIADIRNAFRNVPIDEIYLFFYNSLIEFKKTWYYYIIFEKKKDIVKADENSEVFVTPKNVYNFSKLIIRNSITPSDKYMSMPKLWISLRKNFRDSFITRLCGDCSRNWFSIRNHIVKTYKVTSVADITRINGILCKLIKSIIVDIIFECLIINGTLSTFSPYSEYSNKKLRKQGATLPALSNANIEIYSNHSYWHVTCDKFGNLPKYHLSDGNKLVVKNYFEYTKTAYWYTLYAHNWISQINICHRYLNNRVIYVTGGTGVGKTSQVPKLFYYYQRMLDYNSYNKIIHTIPRINALNNTSIETSMDMGCPIFEYNPEYNEMINTNNFYVQYKYSDSQHVMNTASYYKLMTDGSLISELKKSPFLTNSVGLNNVSDTSGNKIDWMKKYDSKNKFDCVIVDEAHEHNLNMDLILTFMRDTCYVNNSIKLIIISATMEDDEPIYRRYYRRINDNRIYPLSSHIEVNNLDRANVDRRVHISEPGQITRCQVNKIYLSVEQSKKINNNNFLDKCIKYTLDVIKQTTSGHILLFLTGVKDINKAVKIINDESNITILAVGLHSGVDKNIRNFVGNVNNALQFITYVKDDLVDGLEGKVMTKKVSAGTYKRAVIVATNIAEASITIPGLKYVVDSGYTKMVLYDPLEDRKKSVITRISGSSSTQRDGRVGRNEPGTVYHIYAKEDVDNVKTFYKIADSNVDIICDFIKKEIDDVPIISQMNDPNDIKILDDIREDTYMGNLDDFFTNIISIENFIKNKYTYNQFTNSVRDYYTWYGKTNYKKYSEYNDIVNNLHNYLLENHDDYDFMRTESFTSRCHTGYDKRKISDYNLDFYIIHPDENLLVRNMYTGKIMAIKKNELVSNDYYEQIIKSNKLVKIDTDGNILYGADQFLTLKMDLLLNNFSKKMFISTYDMTYTDSKVVFDTTSKQLNDDINEYYSYVNNRNKTRDYKADRIGCVTTFYYRSIMNTARILNSDIFDTIESILWFVYAIGNNIENDVIAVISFIKSFPEVGNWIEKGKNKQRFIDRFSNANGDIYFVWNFWNNIKNFFSQNKIFDELKPNRKYKIKFTENKTKFLAYKNSKAKTSTIDKYYFLIFEKMYKSGELDSTDEYYYYIRNTVFDVETVNSQLIKKFLTEYSASYSINTTELISSVFILLGDFFEIEKKKWLVDYELNNKFDESSIVEDIENDSYTWFSNLKLPNLTSYDTHSIITNYTDATIDTNNQWKLMRITYARSYGQQIAINVPSKLKYLRYVDGRLFVTENRTWSSNNSAEQTLLQHVPKYIIYHNSLDYNEPYISYFTPINILEIIWYQPYYFYRIITEENIYSRPNQEIVSIESNVKKYINYNNLLDLLDKIKKYDSIKKIKQSLIKNY
jgi:hypothetical protein